MVLLHHVEAHRHGVPAGYLPIILGSLGVSVFAGAASFMTSSRSIPLTIAVAGGVSLATAGILLATLIRAFGA